MPSLSFSTPSIPWHVNLESYTSVDADDSCSDVGVSSQEKSSHQSGSYHWCSLVALTLAGFGLGILVAIVSLPFGTSLDFSARQAIGSSININQGREYL